MQRARTYNEIELVDAADELGVTPALLRRIEAGEIIPTLENLMDMSELYDESPVFFLTQGRWDA